MRIDGVSLRFVRIPFKHAFSHALKQRTEAETVLVTVRSTNGTTGIGEIVPRPYLTGETLESVLERLRVAKVTGVCADLGVSSPQLDEAERMGNQQNRLPAAAEFSEFVEALVRKPFVADGQHLVNQQDVRVHMDRHGEAEAHVHAR